MESEVLNPIEVMEIDIRKLFDDYCNEYGIEDMAREKQLRFTGAMTYIYRHYFKGTNKLKTTPSVVVKDSINNMCTNHNAYDIDKLYELYIYIKELANGYDKVASVAVFKALTGISKQTISHWYGLVSDGLSTSSLDSNKKMFIEWLKDCDLDQLKEFNFRTPLGAQEQLNVDHGRQKETIILHQSAALPASQLPVLGQEMKPIEIPQKPDN